MRGKLEKKNWKIVVKIVEASPNLDTRKECHYCHKTDTCKKKYWIKQNKCKQSKRKQRNREEEDNDGRVSNDTSDDLAILLAHDSDMVLDESMWTVEDGN